ncbi:MAG: toprim domain-containing protein [Verrucomicrobiae bacterium]|nr:toprim domain-containing protein [Verrucomicrobiae bacterium]
MPGITLAAYLLLAALGDAPLVNLPTKSASRVGCLNDWRPHGDSNPRPHSSPCVLAPKRSLRVPRLRPGSLPELRELGDQRGFLVEGLRLAMARGMLHFCELFGQAAWCVADQRRELFEFRRLDGKKWDAYGRLPNRKSHCLGHGKRWPIGTLESVPYPKVAFVEGAPDLLAAFHFIFAEEKTDTVAAVAALGASNRHLAPESLALFAGKHVRLFPHRDEAGLAASRAWARQLKEAGAVRVEAFDLSGLTLACGDEGKDLADVAQIDPDCFETTRKFQEVMP